MSHDNISRANRTLEQFAARIATSQDTLRAWAEQSDVTGWFDRRLVSVPAVEAFEKMAAFSERLRERTR
jgi:hypothetical protein